MKNNKVFILCNTTTKMWQLPCANAERHVESMSFAVSIYHDDDCLLSATSPRRELDGNENEKEKYKKLKAALKSAVTSIVLTVGRKTRCA